MSATAEAPGTPAQSCVSLEDVCLHFTTEAWVLLEDSQSVLYYHVMLENFFLVLSLGLPISKSFPGTPVTAARRDSWSTKAPSKGLLVEP